MVVRDVITDADFLSEKWIGASFTPPDERSDEQNQLLKVSNRNATELLEADILVLGVSMHNFGIPSALKAWMDQIAHPGMTFRPDAHAVFIGLATGMTAYLVIDTGKTPIGGENGIHQPLPEARCWISRHYRRPRCCSRSDRL